MTADPRSTLADSDSAERIFIEWLRQCENGAVATFEELCALHPQLRDRLASLRGTHQHAAEVLGQLFAGTATAEPEPPLGLPAARYEVRSQIATGGMGQIYEVYDPSLRRTIAMKVLRAAASGAGADTPELARRRSRLLAEAQILAQLDHPGVVSIHEMGLDDHGRAYFTMKRVRGQEFGAVIRSYHAGEPTWSLTRAVGALLKVCEAVAYAHSKGVIHRDLKPSNVMVGRFGEVFVMDWGLAKVVGRPPAPAPSAPRTGTVIAEEGTPHPDADSGTHADLSLIHTDRESESTSSASSTPLVTLHGDVVGTPAYMPPEQARGEVDGLDARADVYGVGALLYHLLAGKHPYASDAPQGAAAIVARVVASAPAPLARVAPHAPEELVAVCDKAMARDRDQRYRTMLDFADDLRAWLEGRVVRAHKTGALVELRKWIVRNKGAAAAIAAVITGLGATATVQALLKRDVERAQHETAARAEALRQENYRSSIALAAAALKDGPAGRVRKLLDGCPPDLRGWEWRFLSPRTDTADLLIRAPADRSRKALFTPDGCAILTLGAGELSLLDAESGAFVRTIDRLPPGSASFSADGSLLAVLCNGQRLGLWRAGSWQRLPDLDTWTSSDWPAVACSPVDGRAAIFGPQPTQIWDLERRALLAVLDARQGSSRVSWSSDGTRLYTSGQEGSLAVWDTRSFDLIDFAHQKRDRIAGGHPSPNGRWLANTQEHRVMVGDAHTFAIVHRTDLGFSGPVWSPDSSLLAMVAGSTIVLLATDTWTEEARLHGHNDAIGSLAFEAASRRLVSCSFDGDVRVWNLAHAGRRPRVGSNQGEALAPRFSADGKWLAMPWYMDGLVEIWSVPDRRLARCLDVGGRYNGLDLSPDARRLLVLGRKGLTIIDAWDDREIGVIGTGSSFRYEHFDRAALRFSPDGARIAIVGADGTLSVWDASGRGQCWSVQAYDGPSPWPWRLSGGGWSPDGKKLATMPADGRVQIWDAEKGQLLREWRGRGPACRHGRFSADGRRLFLAGAVEHGLECWDVELGACLWDFAREPPAALELSADGTRLFCARAGAVDIRDARSGELIVTLELDPFVGHGFAVSPADDAVVTASTKGLCIWDTTLR